MSRMADVDAELTSPVREKALNLIALAQHPRLVPVRGAKEDTASANREAQLALAAAMVYLADTLREGGQIDGQ